MNWYIIVSLLLILLTSGCINPSNPQSTADAPPSQANNDNQTPTQPALDSVTQTPDLTTASATVTVPSNQDEIAMAPEELSLFQDYLEVVREPSTNSTEYVIEGTVASIQQNEICPYQGEECPIPPYPNDWGLVRIEDVQPASATNTDIAEQPDSAEDRSEGQTTDQNTGIDSSDRNQPALQIGQEVQTQFILTARPAIVRWVPAVPTDDNFEGAASSDGEEDAVSSEAATAPESDFQPIPVEDDHFVFTIGVSTSDQGEERILPGLSSGSKFRALVSYDGVMRVMTYELLS